MCAIAGGFWRDREELSPAPSVISNHSLARQNLLKQVEPNPHRAILNLARCGRSFLSLDLER